MSFGVSDPRLSFGSATMLKRTAEGLGLAEVRLVKLVMVVVVEEARWNVRR